MKIVIKTTNIEATEGLLQSVTKKLNKLVKVSQKQVSPDAVLNIEIGKETKHHEKGKIFFAEGHITWGKLDIYEHITADDLYGAIEALAREMTRKFVSIKEKLTSKERRGSRLAKNQ